MPPASDFADYTNSVIAAIGAKASPRVKEAFPILIKHLHAFLAEADVTMDEWLAACNLLVEAGQVSSDKRNEVVLVSDVLGVESLCDMLDHKRAADKAAESASDTTDPATFSAILGPFYRSGVPVMPLGTNIVRQEEKDGAYTYLYGTVTDAHGKPVKGALVDIWHDAPDGLYDSQSPEKPEYNCRGRFETDAEGKYHLICLKPTPYPIPFDFSAGRLLTMMDRHPMRPAHIHFMVQSPGSKTLVTQVFDRESKYLEDDSVFGVKDDLIVDFIPIEKDTSGWTAPKEVADKMRYALKYDISLLSDASSPADISKLKV